MNDALVTMLEIVNGSWKIDGPISRGIAMGSHQAQDRPPGIRSTERD